MRRFPKEKRLTIVRTASCGRRATTMIGTPVRNIGEIARDQRIRAERRTFSHEVRQRDIVDLARARRRQLLKDQRGAGRVLSETRGSVAAWIGRD
jgi:hypothetical protein